MNALEVFRKALRELSERYARELPVKLAEIEGIWESARNGPHSREAVVAMQRLVHGLDVSASMLGAPDLSEPARQIVKVLSITLRRDGVLNAEESANVESLLADLHRSAEPTAVGTKFDAASASYPRYVREDAPRLIYMLEDDPEAAASLQTQLRRFGYDVQSMPSAEAMVEAIARNKPYSVLVDVDLAGEGYSAAHSIAQLSRSSPDRPPVLFLSSRGDIASRLEAIRAGAIAYFTKPVRIAELVDKLDRLVAWETPEPYRIMIVDSDHSRAEFCRAVLREAGMHVDIVSDPALLITLVNDQNPELLLISLNMPGCSGDELAQAVHQVPSHVSLPVVFLSPDWNLNRQIALMNMGGDALLPLPVDSGQLIATVIARVERYRTLYGLMQQDSLTTLLNHSRLQQYLEIETLRAMRQFHPLSFAMLDIDHFKRVNDKYGHPTGDRVLKSLARFLRQNLRKSDIVGRYGGEEFGIILTDTDGPSAIAVMEKLCADFSEVEHDSDKGSFKVSFSVGVAFLNGHKSSRELVLAADESLYQAKSEGRNRVVLWSGHDPEAPKPANDE